MQPRTPGATCVAMIAALVIPAGAVASGVKYSNGDRYIKVGGHLQLQYHQNRPDSGSSTDEAFFRRLKLTIEGSVHKNWLARVQWDMGKAGDDDEIAIKDAYIEYIGVENMELLIGNVNFPFSRELLTSSKSQQLVERTFVGDHNYGTPDKNLGVHLTGNSADKVITWGASAAFASIDPDVKKLDFDSPVTRNNDFNEGIMVGGRVDYHPFGYLKFSQGDFSDDVKVTVGIAAFSWNNDDDNNTYTPVTPGASMVDVASVTGVEISAALRAAGFSVDTEYNSFNSDTVESSFTGGIYMNGSTTLSNTSIEGGYMFDKSIELVAGYETQDADAYATVWKRTSAGLNWFINGHDTKVQLTYRMGENLDGEKGRDLDEMFLQGQFVF